MLHTLVAIRQASQRCNHPFKAATAAAAARRLKSDDVSPSSPPAVRNARAQQLFAIRSAATAPADAMDIWAVNSVKHRFREESQRTGAPLVPITSLDHIVKRPRDSLLTVILPFGSDAQLRTQYVNWRDQIRVGKLFEEIDSFAGNVAYLHCDDGDPATELPILVTASTDRVDLLMYPLVSDRDYQMRGCVTYAGGSSLNIDIDMSTVPRHPGEAAAPVLQASLTFVARNARTGGAIRVPRLRCDAPWEETLHEAGRKAQEQRKAARLTNIYKAPPTSAELAMVHALFMEINGREPQQSPPATARGGSVGVDAAAAADAAAGGAGSAAAPAMAFIDSTTVTSHELTMPTERNLHGKLFGGYLMRKAFETAWAAGWSLTGTLPKFLALDDITFLKPVQLGRIIRFDACVDFATGPPGKTYGVTVTTTMLSPGVAQENKKQELTNRFHFTFYSDSGAPKVYPRTYAEAMQFIDGHRRHEIGRKLNEIRKNEGVKLRFDLSEEDL